MPWWRSRASSCGARPRKAVKFASAPVAGQLLILGCTWMVLDGSIMLMYVLAGAKLLARLHGTRAGQWFDRATGGAFIAAAGILATSQR